MANELFAYVMVFLFVGLLTDFLRRHAGQFGLLDRPDGRKRHRGVVPAVGGEAIYVGCLLSALALGVDDGHVVGLFGIGSIIVVIGALDDHLGFSARRRLLVQFLAAGAMVLIEGSRLQSLGSFGADGASMDLGLLAAPLTIIGAVGMINAFNMCDGMDGLSGCLAVIALSALAVVAGVGGLDLVTLIVVLTCGVAAFLTQNLRVPWRWRASVFMGDAGSTFMGFAVCWLIIQLGGAEQPLLVPVVAAWFVLVPLFDTTYVILRRLALKRSPLKGDRQHLHHYLQRRGLNVNQSLAVIAGLAVSGAAVGLLMHFVDLPDGLSLLALTGAFAGYCVVMSKAWQALPYVRRHRMRRRRGNDGTLSVAGDERPTADMARTRFGVS